MEVRFLIAKSDLDQILSNSEYALVGVSARKDHTFSSITAEHIGHNNIEDSIFEKASEKHNLMATDALWQEKLSEFERINESVARRIAFRWQMEKKGLEQV